MHSQKQMINYIQPSNSRHVNYSTYKPSTGSSSIEFYIPEKGDSKQEHFKNKDTVTLCHDDTQSQISMNSLNIKKLEINWDIKEYKSTSQPDIFGPSFWFTLHNGASRYPIDASKYCQQRMKSFIIGLPIMIPCSNCQEHAHNFIEKNKDQLDDICSGRTKLFNFFVDFHNKVNERYNKPIVSYDDAYKMYTGPGRVNTMSYKYK
jgi:hypothetical protein